MKVAVARTAADSSARATRLATELELPVIESSARDSSAELSDLDFLLAYRDARLVLQCVREGHSGELCVDFSDAKLSCGH